MKKTTYGSAEIMPNLVGQCEMGHGGRHAVAVVDESDDAGVEALEGLHPLSALRLRVTLVRLTNSTRRAYKNQHTNTKISNPKIISFNWH